MQLVVMAAVLVLVGMGHGCIYNCRKTLIEFTLESEECGKNITVNTFVCAGQCFLRAPVYESKGITPKQMICSGAWTYETAYIDDCPVGISYPAATECGCTTCDKSSTDCDPKPMAMLSCLSK